MYYDVMIDEWIGYFHLIESDRQIDPTVKTAAYARRI